jgi:hypothetical protein
MFEVSENHRNHMLKQPFSYRLGRNWTEDQRLAFLMLASSLSDDATVRDLLNASDAKTALGAGHRSDTVGHFKAIRAALLDANDSLLGEPLFDSVGAFAPRERLTRVRTHCTQCQEPLIFAANTWRDVKERPRVCKGGHVYFTGSYAFIDANGAR